MHTGNEMELNSRYIWCGMELRGDKNEDIVWYTIKLKAGPFYFSPHLFLKLRRNIALQIKDKFFESGGKNINKQSE